MVVVTTLETQRRDNVVTTLWQRYSTWQPKYNQHLTLLQRRVTAELDCYRLRFSQAQWCYNDETTKSISFILRKAVVITLKKNTSYPPSHTIIEDSIRHNIAQMTSTSKVYIPCLLATIIKWCHRIVWDRHQRHNGGR